MTGLLIKDVSLTIGQASILNTISATVQAGEIVGLIGPNGAGKSSLLKSILGLVKIDSGVIELGGRNLTGMKAKERARMMTYAAQGAPVHWPLSVERIVSLGRIPHLSPWQNLRLEDNAEIEKALTITDCQHLKGRLVTTLSGGERARVLLARTIATGAPYILADEPVASLDPFHQLQVMRILKDHAKSGGAVLVVLHDLGLAARYCDNLILLHQGQLIDQGAPENILNEQNMAHVFKVAASHWTDGDEKFLATHPLQEGTSAVSPL